MWMIPESKNTTVVCLAQNRYETETNPVTNVKNVTPEKQV